VFDLTNKDSFHNLKKWIEHNQKHAGEDVMTFLIGAKSVRLVSQRILEVGLIFCIQDLDHQRIVSPEEIETFSEEYNFPYIEISSKTPANVGEAMTKMAELLVDMHS